MKQEIQQLHKVWQHEMKAMQPTKLPFRFDDLISSVFTAGPSYYYVIDFYDMSISHMSAGIQEIHGLNPETAVFNDILSLMHPDDFALVTQAESLIIKMFESRLGWDKLLQYKGCYCIRFKTAEGKYKLFLHQYIQLTVDERGGFGKSLNIHTDISHITSENNNKLSMIGLNGEPSYTDIDIFEPEVVPVHYTRRETEILKMLSSGLSSRQIAETLHLSLNTIKNHRRNMLNKVGLHTTPGLIKACMLKGLI